ncbi:hypothetical protein BJY04DRAFT_79398 [Aspergillus karnatakaensis]|uniref:uncharacterized protein n=1 Tax=Aspergillus karnatakaensis TaxID=1810916 RepID=UPI003CCCE958
MPRPAAKRNRLAARITASSKQTRDHTSVQDKAESRDISRSPRSDAVGSSRLAYSADPSEIIRQLRSHTPLSKAQEFAIGSSPGTEQGATGSRPPTRARGYSSTLSIAGRKGDTSSRIPGTPAFESSILSNFRRRPRQASILHMMNDEDGSSDYDDDDFLGGLSPEDESTPLNMARGKSLVLRPAVSSPTDSTSLPSSETSSKRRRTGEDIGPPQSPLSIVSSATGTRTPGPGPQELNASLDTLQLPQSPAALSETMAPPFSSPVPGLTHEMSTPDSARSLSRLTRPPRSKSIQPTGSKFNVPTAALQDRLLPRRRQRRVARQGASGFDVTSDSDSDDLHSAAPDDDELNYVSLRNRSQTRRNPADKPRAKVSSRAGGNNSKSIKQYGTASGPETNGDKENELSDSSSPLSSALDTDELDSESELEQDEPVKNFMSEELRIQALKFAEVDKWQMEFEDVVTSTVQENGTFR